MNRNILQSLDTLEAIYFLTQSLEGQVLQDITRIRTSLHALSRQQRADLLATIKRDIKALRAHYAAIAPDSKFRELLADARARPGYAYLPKIFIERKLFRHYEKVFPRWPHIGEHAFVIFDGQSNRSMRQIFTLEGALYSDIRSLLACAERARKGIEDKDFRERTKEDQLGLLAHLRLVATAVFHFLEAYLNGLAYDCFQRHHDKVSIAEHDLLAEWDSKKKRRSFLRFETKIFQYPSIIAKMSGIKLDLSGVKATRLLIDYGKKLRDAVTHPSAYVDPQSGKQEKFALVVTISLPIVEKLLAAAREYVLAVEQRLGRDPKMTMPWFFA